MVLLIGDYLVIKLLSLLVSANNQTDIVQIKIAQCRYEVSQACKRLVFQHNVHICSLVTEICYLTFEHYHCTLYFCVLELSC